MVLHGWGLMKVLLMNLMSRTGCQRRLCFSKSRRIFVSELIQRDGGEGKILCLLERNYVEFERETLTPLQDYQEWSGPFIHWLMYSSIYVFLSTNFYVSHCAEYWRDRTLASWSLREDLSSTLTPLHRSWMLSILGNRTELQTWTRHSPQEVQVSGTEPNLSRDF